MKCYRLTKLEHRAAALSGRGAMLAGQRWNSKGVAIAYAGASPSACLVEAMVHVHDDGFPVGWRMLEIEIPDQSIAALAPSDYPARWDESPYREDVQKVGDDWVQSSRSLVLEVSSAIDKTSKNYLINPAHRDFSKIKAASLTTGLHRLRALDEVKTRLHAQKIR